MIFPPCGVFLLEVTQLLNQISPPKLIGFLSVGHREIHQPISVKAVALTHTLCFAVIG